MGMTRRVLHILDPEPHGHIGGADLHVVDLALEQMRRNRYEPTVLLLTEAPMLIERLNGSGVEVIAAHKMGRRYSELPFKLRPTLERIAPDLLHSHGYDANYFACWARMTLRRSWGQRPLLFTSHGWVYRPALLIKTTLDFLTHRFADHIIICSPHQRQRAQWAAGHSAVTFVSNGVPSKRALTFERNEANARFGFPQNTRLVAFVGRLSPEKQVNIFVEIAREVGRRFEDVHFVIAGGGPLGRQIRGQITQPDLAGHITMTGVVPDVDSIYSNIDVLVVPSAMETTSRVTIEAMMWGVPVVASDVGGLPELISSG